MTPPITPGRSEWIEYRPRPVFSVLTHASHSGVLFPCPLLPPSSTRRDEGGQRVGGEW